VVFAGLTIVTHRHRNIM